MAERWEEKLREARLRVKVRISRKMAPREKMSAFWGSWFLAVSVLGGELEGYDPVESVYIDALSFELDPDIEEEE